MLNNNGVPQKRKRPSKYLAMIRSMRIIQEGKKMPRAVILDRYSKVICLYRAAKLIGARIIVRNIGTRRDLYKCWRSQ